METQSYGKKPTTDEKDKVISMPEDWRPREPFPSIIDTDHCPKLRHSLQRAKPSRGVPRAMVKKPLKSPSIEQRAVREQKARSSRPTHDADEKDKVISMPEDLETENKRLRAQSIELRSRSVKKWRTRLVPSRSRT
jgi:hypothetical protein